LQQETLKSPKQQKSLENSNNLPDVSGFTQKSLPLSPNVSSAVVLLQRFAGILHSTFGPSISPSLLRQTFQSFFSPSANQSLWKYTAVRAHFFALLACEKKILKTNFIPTTIVFV
jgi:hypothetical protein